MRAQLLVVPGCPNEALAKSLLHASLLAARLGDMPVDVVVLDSDAAEARAFSGSPSFCVNDVDLFPEAPSGLACRVYRSTEGRLQGLPAPELLVDRLRHVSQG